MAHSDRILIIEDEPNHSKPLQQMLEYRGYELQCIGDANAAVSAVSSFDPFVAIVDLLLIGADGQVADGYDVTRLLRAKWPDLGILVWTSHYATPRDEIRALRAGADDYVRKDTEFGLIEARIEALIRRVRRIRNATGNIR